MKIFIISMILSLSIALMPHYASAMPSISFVSDTHDFGEVDEGTPLEYSFEFTNSGDEELIVDKIVPT